MRILVVGEFTAYHHEEAFCRAFEDLGNEVSRFSTDGLINGRTTYNKLERRLMLGPLFILMWAIFFYKVKFGQYDLIFFRKPMYFPRFILKMSRFVSRKSLFFEYWNDDPFGPDYSREWNKYIHRTIPFFDLNYVFREKNVPEFQEAGSRKTHILFPYYVSSEHWRSIKENPERQITYIGHGEDDLRLDCFDSLLTEKLDLHLAGSGYEIFSKGRKFNKLLPTIYFSGGEYSNALNNSSGCLAFYSKRNNDKYTTRTFEIPAAGSVLISERTGEVESWFDEDEEAIFFSSSEELLLKVRDLISNPAKRNRIASNGQAKLLMLKAEVKDRACQIISDYDKIRS